MGPHTPGTRPSRDETVAANTAHARLLLVDSEPHVHELVRSLRLVGFDVHVAADGEGALRVARDADPDLVVLDVMLPDTDGFALFQRLRARGVHAPVVFLTSRDAIRDKITGLTIGADDYITKPFRVDEVIARIRAVLRRTQAGAQTASSVLTHADIRLDERDHGVTRSGQPVELTATEFNLLRYLMLNPGQVLTKAQILNHVWQSDWGRDVNIVETYISYLRRKLDINCEGPASATTLIQTRRGVGYTLRQVPSQHA
ncbi:MAG: response regulator transcription factor [Phycicoccus sp.]|nr:response regulator transcription factor [Phycicoccus sp.]NMM35288.1 response regulator transcription factor [Phycicoccus sp.]